MIGLVQAAFVSAQNRSNSALFCDYYNALAEADCSALAGKAGQVLCR